MINEVSPELMEKALAKREEWMDLQTTNMSDEFISSSVVALWERIFNSTPEVHIFDSPDQAYLAAKEAEPSITPKDMFVSYLQHWAAYFEGGEVLGVDYNEGEGSVEDYHIFCNFCRAVLACVPFNEAVFVSRRPVKIHWDGPNLHNESGPSVEFADGTGIYSLEGYPVDETLVMRPQEQDLETIINEPNEEVKRIRIERYGILRYLQETGAEVLDSRRNDIENTYEVLVRMKEGTHCLATHCPTTGRRYLLDFPEDETPQSCEEAQRMKWGLDKPFQHLGRT